MVLFFVVLSFNRKVAIDGDAKDYYSYLVSVFIDHNFTQQHANDWYLIQTPTGTINVHTIGVSLLLAPFFFIAFLFSKLFGYELDGFSLPFQLGVYAAGLFYCTLGLIFLKKLLLQLNIKQKYIALLMVLCCFGTHLFSYTVNEPGMPHVYSFALITIFLYLFSSSLKTQKARYFYLSALVLGLIILVRPVNVIILVFLPFFFQNTTRLLQTVKEMLGSKHFYFSFFVLILTCSFQSIAWYLQNGKLFQDSYVGNGFYFNDPQIFKMLFGFNNGLFIYVPLTLLLLTGMIPIFMNNKFKGTMFLLSISFIVYIFASYWAYNYFDGFGIRTFVDFLPVFIIAGAFLFQELSIKFSCVIGSFALVLLFLNLFQTFQYRNGLIKGNGMNFEKYRYVFLRSNTAYSDSLGGSHDLPLYAKAGGKLLYDNFDTKVYDFNNYDTIVVFNYKIKTNKANGFYTLVEFERKEKQKNSSFDAIIVLNASDPLGTYKNNQAFRLNDIPSKSCCEWKKYSYSIASTGKFFRDDKLHLKIINTYNEAFSIKNLNVKIFDYSYNI